jgi:NADH-quinone oxidoreductase subunit N
MLAYSSVSHAGYLLFAVVAMNRYSTPSLLYYSIAYSFATLAAFAILMIVSEQTGNTKIESLKGLVRTNPFLGIMVAVSMFSLAGIPPLAGFFAKYYLFTAALYNGNIWLVLFGIVGTLIGVYYYFRVAATVFQAGNENATAYKVPLAHTILLWLALIVTVVLGLMPNLLIGLW